MDDGNMVGSDHRTARIVRGGWRRAWILPLSLLALSFVATPCAAADEDVPEGVVCKDGVCEISPEWLAKMREKKKREKGSSVGVLECSSVGVLECSNEVVQTSFAANHEPRTTSHESRATNREPRIAMGYMGADDFLAFLFNTRPSSNSSTLPLFHSSTSTLEHSNTLTLEHSLLWLFLLAFVGGAALNLTPCVLPLVPVNLIIIGKGWRRGAAYGAGMATTYGALGLASAFGGVAFGAVQSSPWFNGAAAAVFAFLALAMLDVVVVNGLSSLRKPGARKVVNERGLFSAFLLGGGAALLAGACVAPVAIAACTEAAVRCAAGERLAVALPFALGLGMAVPYPFLAGGMMALPRPGKWMSWTKRVFALVLFGFAIHYAMIAYNSIAGRPVVGTCHNSQSKTLEHSNTQTLEHSLPRLFVVGAPWCKNCAAMERTTLKEPRVADALAGFEVVRVEIDDFDELRCHPLLGGVAERIKGLPAYVVFGAR